MKNNHTFIPGIAVGIGLVVAAFLIFIAGIWVGERRLLMHPMIRRAPWSMHNFRTEHFEHGTIGTIDTVADKNIHVKDRRGGEKIVVIDAQTSIQKSGITVLQSALKIGDVIIVSGEPIKDKADTILARIIRVMTAFPQDATGSAIPLPSRKFPDRF